MRKKDSSIKNLFRQKLYRYSQALTRSDIALNLKNLNPANFIQACYCKNITWTNCRVEKLTLTPPGFFLYWMTNFTFTYILTYTHILSYFNLSNIYTTAPLFLDNYTIPLGDYLCLDTFNIRCIMWYKSSAPMKIETSELICKENQLFDFNILQTLT